MTKKNCRKFRPFAIDLNEKFNGIFDIEKCWKVLKIYQKRSFASPIYIYSSIELKCIISVNKQGDQKYIIWKKKLIWHQTYSHWFKKTSKVTTENNYKNLADSSQIHDQRSPWAIQEVWIRFQIDKGRTLRWWFSSPVLSTIIILWYCGNQSVPNGQKMDDFRL